jgi:hypothetical protein
VLLRKAPLQGLNRLRGFTNQTIESRSARSSKKRCAICVPKVIWNSKRNSRLRRWREVACGFH